MIKSFCSLCLSFLVVTSIILSGCSAPTLLDTPEAHQGLNCGADFSVSLIAEESGFWDKPYVMPQWAFTLYPALSAYSNAGVQVMQGLKLGLISAVDSHTKTTYIVPIIEPTTTVKAKLLEKGSYAAAVVGEFIGMPPILPFGRVYIVGNRKLQSVSFYGSIFFDWKLITLSDIDIGNGGPGPRTVLGVGTLLGIALRNSFPRILGEFGLGMYSEEDRYFNRKEIRPHPFVGIGVQF